MKTRWVALALAAGLLFPILALPDAVLADSMSIRVKERVLGWSELFHPDQTQVINPYYRPLFSVLHGGFDRLFGHSHLGLRVLALVCHGLAAIGLLRLARTLGHRRVVTAAAVLWFLWTPGNVFTACWPIVAYWSLAAALGFAAVDGLVRFQARGGAAALLATLLFTVLSLLTSQTAYHFMALALLLLVFPAIPPERPGARRRALAVGLLLGALAYGHFRWLEQVAQGMAGGSLGDRLQQAAVSYPGYFLSTLGSDHVVGLPWLGPIAGAILLVALLGAERRHFWILGYALVAPLPFAAISFSDRAAYHSSALLALFGAGALLEALPRVVTRVQASARCGRQLGGTLLVALLAVLGVQSVQRFAGVHDAAVESRQLYRDLDEILPQLPALPPERRDPWPVAFVNWPRMLKWPLNDRLGIQRPEDLVEPRVLAFFHTESSFFALGSADLSASFEAVVACENGRLVLRDPAHPMGDRTALSPLWYLAPAVEVIPRSGFRRGPRGDEEHRRAIESRLAKIVDPRQLALLETDLKVDRLARDGLREARFDRGGSPQTRDGLGAYFPGQLIADFDLREPGLWVVITYLASEDPVLRVAGSLGRFCDWMQATVDGKEVPVLPIYYHCTGVLVPEGRHQVIIQQRPPGQ